MLMHLETNLGGEFSLVRARKNITYILEYQFRAAVTELRKKTEIADPEGQHFAVDMKIHGI